VVLAAAGVDEPFAAGTGVPFEPFDALLELDSDVEDEEDDDEDEELAALLALAAARESVR